MIGRTLFIYFFRRYLAIVVQVFVGVVLIAFIADFTEFSRRFGALPDYTAAIGLTVSAMRVPFIVQTAIPFIVLIAAMATLMTLNRKYELVIARAAGISAWQFLAPLCLASLLIGAVTVGVWNPLAAKALSYSEEVEAELRGDAYTAMRSRAIPWLRQRTDEGSTIIGAKKTSRGGLLLAGATFLRLDDEGRITARYDARRAGLYDGNWRLVEVTKHVPGGTPEKIPWINIKSGLKPEYIEEQFAQPEAVPFYELGNKIEAARSFGLSPNAFLTQFHSLGALPVLLVAMTLIAATVSMRFARLGQSAPMILGGILAGFLLYVVSVLVKAFGSAGLVPPVAAAWFPVVVAMFYGVTFLLHKEDG